MKFRHLTAAAGVLAVAAFSAGAGTPGWYIGGGGGASFLEDMDNALETDPDFDPGTPGTGGGSFLELPGIITLFPTPGMPGSPASLTPGQDARFGTETDDGWLGNFTIGHQWERGWRLELEGRYSENDFEDMDGQVEAAALMLNSWYDFNAHGRFHPYIGVGVGAAQLEADLIDGFNLDDDTVFAYQAGAGIAFDITDRLTADLGYRYFATDDPTYSGDFNGQNLDVDSEYEQQAAMLSLRWVFAPTGRADADGDGVPDYKDKCPNTPEGAPVDVDGCPLDSDGDGVLDNLDKCPNTPAGVTVGADGCPLDADADGVPDDRDQCPNTPAGVAVDDTGCPIDSDGDGVPDYKDKCPNTPAGVQVNADGCPLVVDADGDGVPDDQDKCPDTPAGVPVTSDGCAVGQKQILRGVNYEFNKATLTANAERILDQVAQTLRDSPGFVVELAGHTDSKGSDSYNQDLSQRRAEAAMAYLITAGIDASRLRARGYGESQPIEPNTTPSGADNPEGRAANRRTEFRVIGRQ
jgi:outer membrane protein OmpA-like peptidoglycan-associated protein/opacity protein-like surface antigen